jgi:hypothetical protein
MTDNNYFESYVEQLKKVMKPEMYNGVPLRNILGKWVYGVRSFDTKDELKKFIDKCKK